MAKSKQQRSVDDRLWELLEALGPGIPPGAGSAPGRPPESGSSCTSWCSTNCPTARCWTGHGRASTRCRCARKGGELTGRNPTERGKLGSKYHLLVDRNGLPLHVLLSGANTHARSCSSRCSTPSPASADTVTDPDGPHRRPEKLHADKGYDCPRCRRYLHRRGIKVRIAWRGIADKSTLGRDRWGVERTVSWLLRFTRLGLRYDRTERTVRPLLLLAVSVSEL